MPLSLGGPLFQPRGPFLARDQLFPLTVTGQAPGTVGASGPSPCSEDGPHARQHVRTVCAAPGASGPGRVQSAPGRAGGGGARIWTPSPGAQARTHLRPLTQLRGFAESQGPSRAPWGSLGPRPAASTTEEPSTVPTATRSSRLS